MLQLAQSVIDYNTFVPLGVIVAIWIFAFPFLVKAVRLLQSIDQRLTALEQGMAETWSLKDMRIWELELRNGNPTLQVPNSFQIVESCRRKR